MRVREEPTLRLGIACCFEIAVTVQHGIGAERVITVTPNDWHDGECSIDDGSCLDSGNFCRRCSGKS